MRVPVVCMKMLRKTIFYSARPGPARHIQRTLNPFLRTYIDDDDHRRHLTNNHISSKRQIKHNHSGFLFFCFFFYFGNIFSLALDFAGVMYFTFARSFVFRLIWKLNTNNVMSQHYTMPAYIVYTNEYMLYITGSMYFGVINFKSQ